MIEKSAVALLLQSFYNGIENILIIIVKYFDARLPNSSKWHKELLEKAFEESGKYRAFPKTPGSKDKILNCPQGGKANNGAE